jgi:hypothetical protein
MIKHKHVKAVESIGVVIAISTALYLSIEQENADMALVFSLFLTSSIILTATTYLIRNTNFLMMNIVYLLINLNGFINS